jgi:hypothetical protein
MGFLSYVAALSPSPWAGEGWREGEEILKVLGYENVRIDPALKGTIPDLQTDNHSIPPLEKGGEGGFESGAVPEVRKYFDISIARRPKSIRM